MTTTLQVTFGIPEPSDSEAHRELADQIGLGPKDLADLEAAIDAEATLAEGSFGIGASGFGVSVLLALSDNAVSTVAGLLVIGGALRGFIRKVTGRPQVTMPSITESYTQAAIAAAGVPKLRHELIEMTFVEAKPLDDRREGRHLPGTAWGGTDPRDVWCVVFYHSRRGYSLMIFVSPTGVILGYVRVPHEMFFDGDDWIHRSEEEVRNFQVEESDDN
ncbi:hypothetical protein K8Z49_27710 [Actinomadura madurae]|uniref:hypothetical protein n=1 Tax=Actinomadura madurae TaxID=1993 RepID=UPI003999DD9F